jgi:hypothetical protein
MADPEQLQAFLADLVEVLHLQAKELEKLVTHVEQQTTRMVEPSQFSVVASELSELHHRIKQL